ncbi:MAG: hypothetical protein HY709_08235, partial [Candidatus Latescibacteria bacterium]|nr:hypothetical protein [Candidatus Latescibacterota bacterium]
MVCFVVVMTVSLGMVVVPGSSGAFVCAGGGDFSAESLVAKRLGASVWSSPEPVGETYEALVVFARFADDPPQTVPAWAESLFRPEVPGSVAHYYEEQSFGRLHLRGSVLPQVYVTAGPQVAYLAPDAAQKGGVTQFVREVIERVDPDVDFRRFDEDRDGVVDLVVVLVVSEAIPNFIRGPATGLGRLGLRREG